MKKLKNTIVVQRWKEKAQVWEERHYVDLKHLLNSLVKYHEKIKPGKQKIEREAASYAKVRKEWQDWNSSVEIPRRSREEMQREWKKRGWTEEGDC